MCMCIFMCVCICVCVCIEVCGVDSRRHDMYADVNRFRDRDSNSIAMVVVIV